MRSNISDSSRVVLRLKLLLGEKSCLRHQVVVVERSLNELLLLVTDHLLSELGAKRLHLHHQIKILSLHRLELLLARLLLRLRIQKRLSQHISVIAQALHFVLRLLDEVVVELVDVFVVQGFLLEVLRLRLQVLNHLILRHFKHVRIDLIPELFELAHDHAHVPSVRI